MVFLAGCGGSGGTVAPAVNPLTNPDVIVFASGRAADAAWHFYAMNPDGSGVTQLPGSLGTSATYIEGVSLNQTGTYFTTTISALAGSDCYLTRLSDNTSVSHLRNGSLAANSNGTQLAFAGVPAASDPYAIYLLNPAGTQKTQVAPLPAADGPVTEITFAPDDKTLYYVTAPAFPNSQAGNGILYRLTSGGTPVAIVNNGIPIASVHTSRDGKRLAFVSSVETADQSSITFTAYTLNSDGTGLTKGATTTVIGNPGINGSVPPTGGAVSPLNISMASRADGFHVLYMNTVNGIEELFDMHPDGSGLKQITFNAGGNAIPASRAAVGSSIRMLGGR